MEQSNRKRPHLERVLFVVGMQHAGKSTLLRRMFVDPRLGTGGMIPTAAKIRLVSLSRERCLFVRCTSPHERGETLDQFLQKLDRTMERAWYYFWRFNLACAMQPDAANSMPDLVRVCHELQRRLLPERIRVIQIDPRQDNQPGRLLNQNEIDQLRELNVEVVTIDGRRPATQGQYPNGLLLADFFDFT